MDGNLSKTVLDSCTSIHTQLIFQFHVTKPIFLTYALKATGCKLQPAAWLPALQPLTGSAALLFIINFFNFAGQHVPPYAMVLLQSSGMIWSPPLRGRFPVPVGSDCPPSFCFFCSSHLVACLADLLKFPLSPMQAGSDVTPSWPGLFHHVVPLPRRSANQSPPTYSVWLWIRAYIHILVHLTRIST